MLIKFNTKKITLDVSTDSTVQQLKDGIEAAEGIPTAEQRLIFQGKQLSDSNKRLAEFAITSTSTLLLLPQTNPSKNITMYVRTIQRELDYKLVVSVVDKIGTVRTFINEKVNLPPNYSLVYNGIVLNDEGTVLEYGIKERSSVYIVTQIVMEVENPTGERVKMRINDSRITGEVVERLVEQRRAVRTHRKRKQRTEEARADSLENDTASTTATTSDSPTEECHGMFSGLRRGFLNAAPSRKRSRTIENVPSAPPTTCAAAAVATTETVSTSCGGEVNALSAPITKILPPLTENAQASPVMSIAEPQTVPTPTTPCSTPIKPVNRPTTAASVDSPRCAKCTKKIGITGIKCRCAQHFCGAHRYPEEHTCTFDYRTQAKVELAKANPRVASRKIAQIGK